MNASDPNDTTISRCAKIVQPSVGHLQDVEETGEQSLLVDDSSTMSKACRGTDW